ncbi:MAG TPA: cytochrome c [Longimicrobiales bacterium]
MSDQDPIPGFRDATHGERAVPREEIEAHEASLPEPGQHDFEPDVERLHRPIFREPRDPIEGREPVPWWVWAAAALSLFWGGWYLGRLGGNFGLDTHLAYARLERYVEEEAAARFGGAAADPLAAGQRVYTSRCQACHQASGRGVPGAFPPLIGSEWVVGPPEIPVLIVLHGLEGPIQVAGALYAGAMPPWRDALSNAEIAAVATYIRQWGSNDAPAVEPAMVTRLREATRTRRTPWTIEELSAAVESGEFSAAAGEAGAGEAGADEAGAGQASAGQAGVERGGLAGGRAGARGAQGVEPAEGAS